MSEDSSVAWVPKLRFPEFRGAEGWDADGLGVVANFVNEKIALENVALANYVSTENILADYGGIAKASKLPKTGSVTRFQSNDTLISNIRPYLKKVWVADKDGGASNDVVVIRAKQKLLAQYLSALLKNDTFIDYVMTGAKGVKMPRGDIGSMKAYPARYPSKPEQQKIADCLSSVDELIAAQARKVDALKTHKKGLMQQLFPTEGETQPRLRFPEFNNAEAWSITTLGKHIQLQSGFAFSSTYFGTKGQKLVTPKNFTKFGLGNFDESISKYTTEKTPEKYICRPGDLLVLLTDLTPTCELLGKPLEVSEQDGKVLLNQRVAKIELVSNDVLKTFLKQFFLSESYNEVIVETASGSTVKHSSNKVLLNMEVVFPGREEQQRIADFLTSLDDLITAATQELDTFKTHKKALMQQLFPSAQAVQA